MYFSRNGAGLPVRIWRDLEESSYNGRFNLIYKHNLGGISAETSVGGFYLRKQREFATEFFTIDYVGSTLDLNGNANNLLNNIWALNDPTGAFLFGTFQEELEKVPCVYGTLKPVNTWNPFIINFQHLWYLIVDAWHTRKLKNKVKIWFMPTGWRPDDVKIKIKRDKIINVYSQKKYEINIKCINN